jgi:hypothetical protein
MVRLTTVALIERKPDISRSLFTRYWRDVHGVMAARIPGFESYVQYHVTPLAGNTAATAEPVAGIGTRMAEPFEGIAIVTFADAADRAGLADSDISHFIQRDEQNVFRRALLYNLEAGASVTRRADPDAIVNAGPAWLAGSDAAQTAGPAWLAGSDAAQTASPAWRSAATSSNHPSASSSSVSVFVLVAAAAGLEPGTIASALGADGLVELHTHDLISGDPSAWNETDVDDGGGGRRFRCIVQGRWVDVAKARAAIARATTAGRGEIASYVVDDMYVMVERGRPTPLGLRGWDALQTIHEAGAANQLEDAVMDAIYRLSKGRADAKRS